jgi:rubredoxin
MFKKNYIVKINLPGGIVAAGDLYAIADAAGRARVRDMQFGSRQQLYCKVADRYGAAFLGELDSAGIFYETEKERYPNIISSYVAEGVFGRSAWLSEGLYKDILEGFDFRPRLKINLVEDGQSFVPFFTGHLNFISSSLNNHWHLTVRLPGTNRLFQWKTVIYSPDIPRISRLIEESLLPAPALAAPSPELWFHQLYEQVSGSFAHNPASPPLRLSSAGVPYYEGFNSSGSKHWLGIYRREELFAPDFLKEVCLLALHTKIGQLYTTPWKSLLIKGIETGDVNRWEYILGKHRINDRHAGNELNWQTEDLNAEGLRLKRYLIRQLDQDDVRTQGLTFAIKMQQGSGLPGSIVIRKSENPKAKKLDRYSIWHTPDFDPHTMQTVLYREDLEKETLYPYIVSLCKEFYRRQSEHLSLVPDVTPPSSGQDTEKNTFHCIHCLTAYSQEYGDPARDIQPGTPFDALPEHWSCPVCDGPKSAYQRSAPLLCPANSLNRSASTNSISFPETLMIPAAVSSANSLNTVS